MRKLMKRLGLLLATACGLLAQNPNTAQFPGATVTDNQLQVASNNAQTTLTSNVLVTDTVISVNSTTTFILPTVISIDNEIIEVCSAANNQFTVCGGGRGFDGTSAAGHNSGTGVFGNVTRWYHNQVAAEVKAIETALRLTAGSVYFVGAGGGPSQDNANFSYNSGTHVLSLNTLVVSILSGGGTQCVQTNNAGQLSGTGSACTGAPAFGSITSGTNANTLTMGTGGLLTFSGSGAINANQILGRTISGFSGNNSFLVTSTAAFTVLGDGVKMDANGNLVDTGSAAGTVTNTGGSLTAGAVVLGAGGNDTKVDASNFFWDAVNHRLGLLTNTPGVTLDLAGGANERLSNTSVFSFLNPGGTNGVTMGMGGTSAFLISQLGNASLTIQTADASASANLILHPGSTANLIFSNLIGGGIQCIHSDNSGNITGTGTDCGSGSAGANTALSNLAAVNINTALLAQTGVDLGSNAKAFRYLYLFGNGTYGTNSYQLTGTPTHGPDALTLPDYLTANLLADGGVSLTTNRVMKASSANSVANGLLSDSGTVITMVSGTWDLHSGPSHTLPILAGLTGAKPATCTVGEMYFATDAVAGVNLYFCTATNVFTQEATSNIPNFDTPENHGCIGDGVNDDTSCLQAAINAVDGANKTLWASKKYKITGTVSAAIGNFTIDGGGTILVSAGTGATAELLMNGPQGTGTTTNSTTTLSLANRFTTATKTIGFTSVSGFAVNNVVNLCYDDGTLHYEQNDMIQSINGSNVTFYEPIVIPVDATHEGGQCGGTFNLKPLGTLLIRVVIRNLNFDGTNCSATANECLGLAVVGTQSSTFDNLRFVGFTSTTNDTTHNFGSIYTGEGYRNTFSNIEGFNGGHGSTTNGGARDDFSFWYQSNDTFSNIRSYGPGTTTDGHAIVWHYNVLANASNIYGGGHSSGRGVKIDGTAWSNFTNLHGELGGSTQGTACAISFGSYSNNITNLTCDASNSSQGIGLWFDATDDEYNTIENFVAFSSANFDLQFNQLNKNNQVLNARFGTFQDLGGSAGGGDASDRVTLAGGTIYQYELACSGTVAASNTFFFTINSAPSTLCSALLTSGNTSNTNVVVASPGFIKNLRINTIAGGTNASSGVFTLLKNNGASTVTCTLGTGTSCSDLLHQVQVAAGDTLQVRYTTQAAETFGNISVSFEY